MEKIESPCLKCKHHIPGTNRSSDRCKDCPDAKDYLLRVEEKEPYHRGFNPNKPGFEPIDGQLYEDPNAGKTMIKITKENSSSLKEFWDPKAKPIKQSGETDTKNGFLTVNSVSQRMMPGMTDIKQKDSESNNQSVETKQLPKNKQCKECSTEYRDIENHFTKSAYTEDGFMHVCKACISKKMVVGRKNAKQKKAKPVIKKELSQRSKPVSGEETKQCSKCGTVFSGEKIKQNFAPHNVTADGLSKMCKTCSFDLKSKTSKKAWQEKQPDIKLSFTEYPDLLEKLKSVAKDQFRTVESQILFIINHYFFKN